jgi:hypothetical protein
MGIIIDYSLARPTIAQLKAASVESVGRYLGWDGVDGRPNTGKNLSKSELDELHAAGISVFLAFEYTATAALNGASQGKQDGQLAGQQIGALGLPPDMGVYFAVDFDTADYAPSLPNTPANAVAKLGPIADYFRAINALKPRFAVGVYGGYWVVKRLLDAKLATLSWQTIAWSGGNEDSRINLFQTVNAPPIPGIDINEHIAKTPSWGQFPIPTVTKPPAPKSITIDIPAGVTKATITWN